jgi:hypothetical protein
VGRQQALQTIFPTLCFGESSTTIQQGIFNQLASLLSVQPSVFGSLLSHDHRLNLKPAHVRLPHNKTDSRESTTEQS